MRNLTRGRRIVLAAVSLLLAYVLLRGHVAAALVSRGDEYLSSGNLDGAVRIYGRSLVVDPGAPVAADRLAFALLLRRKPGDAQRAYSVASKALRDFPKDARLLVDRAFGAQRLRRWDDAALAFSNAAAAASDSRYAHLATLMTVRGRRDGAR